MTQATERGAHPAGSRAAPAPSREPYIDADIHVYWPDLSALDPFLAARWREHARTYGPRFHVGSDYPRFSPNAARTDAWPPSGLPPGADLDFLRSQLLDDWNVEYAVMNPLTWGGSEINLEFAAALCSAINDWQVHAWVRPEPRLRASVIVPWEDAELAAKEIARVGHDPAFVQVLLLARTLEPLGRRRYWPLYRAAVEHDLPVAIHLGGWGGGPLTGAGFPSFYIEERVGITTAFQDQLTSMVFEGVFERFPTLRFVLIEGGWGWLLPLMWRLDRAFELLGSEVPHVRRRPSRQIREQVYVTTQPIEEPPRKHQLLDLIAELEMDEHLLFATDYPHWDFDAPDMALPPRMDPLLTKAIRRDNARRLFRLPPPADSDGGRS